MACARHEDDGYQVTMKGQGGGGIEPPPYGWALVHPIFVMFNPEEVGANSARFAPGIMNPAV